MSIFTDFDASYGDGMDPCNIDENASIDVVDDVLSDDNADQPYGTDLKMMILLFVHLIWLVAMILL